MLRGTLWYILTNFDNQPLFCTTSETDREVGAKNMFKPLPHPQLFINDRSKVVILLWFSVVCFWWEFGTVLPAKSDSDFIFC